MNKRDKLEWIQWEAPKKPKLNDSQSFWISLIPEPILQWIEKKLKGK